MAANCGSAARMLKQLAHPRRLQLLCHLAEGEKSVGELERLCLASQSQMSQFLTRMRSEGLVDCQRQGSNVFYRIQDPRVRELIAAMHKVFCR